MNSETNEKSKCPDRLARFASCARLALQVSLIFVAALSTKAATVPTPQIEGPILGDPPGSKDHNYTFLATTLPPASHNRVEQEFFMSGVTNIYDASQHIPLEIKGNTVVSVNPRGKNGAIYERASYKASEVPWRTVQRFVPDPEISW